MVVTSGPQLSRIDSAEPLARLCPLGIQTNMAAGYVYILINHSMPGLLKIGKTIRDCRVRARELSTTGVPTPFQVAFELFSEDHEALERTIHE